MSSASGVPVTMTKNKTARVVLIAAVAMCAAVLSASAQSLGDVARQETARRKAVKAPVQVFTNGNIKVVPPAAPPVAPGEPGAQPAVPAGAAPADAAAEKPPEAPDPTKDPEVLAQAHHRSATGTRPQCLPDGGRPEPDQRPHE